MRSRLPYTVPAITVNRYCSSGLQSIAYAAEKIMLGAYDTAIAGGAESMSQVPMMGHVTRPNLALAEKAPEYYMSIATQPSKSRKNTASPVRIKTRLPFAATKTLLKPLQKENLKMKLYP